MAKHVSNWCVTLKQRWLEDDKDYSHTEAKYVFRNNGICIIKFGSAEVSSSGNEKHYHCLFEFKDGRGKNANIIQTSALIHINNWLDTIKECERPSIYCKPLEGSKTAYLNYATKTDDMDSYYKQVDAALSEAGVEVNSQNMLKVMVREKGTPFTTKRKAEVDLYLATKDIDDFKKVKFEIPFDEKIKMFDEYIRLQYEALQSREIKMPNKFKLTSKQDRWKYCLLIITCMHYLDRIDGDDLPSLAFVGDSDAGKSSYFKFIIGRKNIARDASGVGRFKILPNHNTVVLDDWRFPDIDIAENSVVLRSMALGEPTEIKVHSKTETAKAMFVAMTSNDTEWLTQITGDVTDDAQKHSKAWLRRFVGVVFDDSTYEISKRLTIPQDKELYRIRLLKYFNSVDFNNCEFMNDKYCSAYYKHLVGTISDVFTSNVLYQ